MRQTHLLSKALEYAERKHKGQEYSGRPFIYHPIQTYSILASQISPKQDENLLAAAYLHDILEDTQTTLIELEQQFNKDIAGLVWEVTKSEYNTFPYLKTRRGVILKFADRLANLLNIEKWDQGRQTKFMNKSKFWKTENTHE